jgi:hypothetical protein
MKAAAGEREKQRVKTTRLKYRENGRERHRD